MILCIFFRRQRIHLILPRQRSTSSSISDAPAAGFKAPAKLVHKALAVIDSTELIAGNLRIFGPETL